MEPQIRYARTSEGANIAYSTMGTGAPLIHMSIGLSHLQLEWQFPEMRRWYERLARRATLVRYDNRGMGLSDRSVEAFSLEARVSELEGVVDHLAIDRFALFGQIHSGPIAVRYAAEHPERVSHLILWNTYASGRDWAQVPEAGGTRGLVRSSWQLYTETMAHVILGWEEGEPARRYAALVREAVSPDIVGRALLELSGWDVTPLLANVAAPALVMARRQAPAGASLATRLAAGIPNARLAVLEGSSGVPYLGDWEAVASAIDEFLSEGSAAEPSAATVPSGLVTILFTDITDSTALTQRLGDAKAQELVRAHNAIVREALAAHDGNEIKHTGDGIMASFTLASGALECAIAIQRAVEGSGVGGQGSGDLAVHIGVNAGEPVAEEQDLFGTAVQLARRICDCAAGAEILVSNVVRELTAGKGFLFADRGDTTLRGYEDPVRLYELRWREEG